MKRGEKKQKFHDALLQMLYPPPPPPPPQQEGNQKSLDAWSPNLNLDYIPDELDEGRGSTSSTDGDEEEGHDGPKKLTRAQRKRLRKKKLKEANSRRRRIIGPLLPNASEDGIGEGDVVKEEPQGVRENAAEKDGNPQKDKPGSKQNKLKQRRTVKKLASESRKPSSTGNCNEDAGLCDNGNA